MYNRRGGNQHHGLFFLFFNPCLFTGPNKGVLKESNFLEANRGFLCNSKGESLDRSCSGFTGSSVSVLGIHRTGIEKGGKKMVSSLNLSLPPAFSFGSWLRF